MTDKEKIKKIEEIISGGNNFSILKNAEKSIKEKLGFTVELNLDGTIRKAWWGDKPTRNKK